MHEHIYIYTYIYIYIYTFVYMSIDTFVHIYMYTRVLREGKSEREKNIKHINVSRIRTCAPYILPGTGDAYDALSCRSFSAKEPLIIGLFCGK